MYARAITYESFERAIMEMEKVVSSALAGVVLMLTGGSVNSQAQSGEVTTVNHVDLKRYIGTWYEIARLPNSFQKQCARNTTATYTLRDDGRIDVLNKCTKSDGDVSQANGVARIVDTTTNAKLEVSFVRFLGIQFFWGDYWIIGLDSEYRYAIVGTPSRKYGWILSRTPALSDEDQRTAFEILRSQGYNPSEFIKTEQTR